MSTPALDNTNPWTLNSWLTGDNVISILSLNGGLAFLAMFLATLIITHAIFMKMIPKGAVFLTFGFFLFSLSLIVGPKLLDIYFPDRRLVDVKVIKAEHSKMNRNLKLLVVIDEDKHNLFENDGKATIKTTADRLFLRLNIYDLVETINNAEATISQLLRNDQTKTLLICRYGIPTDFVNCSNDDAASDFGAINALTIQEQG